MKHIYLLLVGILCHISLWAQTSWTGAYRLGDPNIKESSHGLLDVSQVAPDQWKFILHFHDQQQEGTISGIFTIASNKTQGVYATDKNDPSAPCSIIFQLKNNEIFITQDGTAKSCGFGAELDATGSYLKYNEKPMNAIPLH